MTEYCMFVKNWEFSKLWANFWPDELKLQHIPATLQKKWAHFIKYWLRYSQISFAIFSVASPLLKQAGAELGLAQSLT